MIDTGKYVLKYEGFESVLDIEEDIREYLAELPLEFQGVVRITLEYIEEGS